MVRSHYAIACVLAAALAPAGAGPRSASDISDLGGYYVGAYHTTDGGNQSGLAVLEVEGKDGKEFAGSYSYTGPAPLGGGPGQVQFDVRGSVSAQGKIKVKGTLPEIEGLTFGLKGTLSDEGELIIALYQVRQGKKTLSKGICFLEDA